MGREMGYIMHRAEAQVSWVRWPPQNTISFNKIGLPHLHWTLSSHHYISIVVFFIFIKEG